MRSAKSLGLLALMAASGSACTAILGSFDFEGEPVASGGGGAGGTTSSTSSVGGSTTSTTTSSNTGGSVSGCANETKDGDETDIDCGGSCIAKCDDGKTCGTDDDCKSVNCFGGTCVSCSDGLKDGDETDVDCGGSCTAKCEDGATCGVDADCKSVDCFGGVCISCMDGELNGDETDKDCGGSCATKCADGRTCKVSGDCANVDCFGGVCISCSDGNKTGDESDVDCGGSCSTKCGFGATCSASTDCASTYCNSGACGAFTVLSMPGQARRIAVDPTNVYFVLLDVNVGDGTVQKAPVTGGAPTQLAYAPNGIGCLAIDATNVYYCTANDVMKAPIVVGGAVKLATGNTPNGLAVGSGSVYWTNYGDGSLYKIGVFGGTATQLAPPVAGGGGSGIAVSASDVYWTDLKLGTVSSVALAGGAVTVVASGQGAPFAVAPGLARVFWLNGSNNTGLHSAPLAGGTPTLLLSQDLVGLALDASFAYAVSLGPAGTLYRVALNGGQVVVLAQGITNAENITVDADYVYWTENTTTTAYVKKIHK